MLRTIRTILSHLNEIKTRKYLSGLQQKGLRIGTGTTILEPFFIDPDHCFQISIGARCTLAPNVRLIAHDASTKQYLGYTRIGRIDIGDNCFLGDSVIVLPGVRIGEASIIGAGSIVVRNIPAHSVAAGNPARVICSLEEYLERMRLAAERAGVLGEEYLIGNISAEHKAALQKMLLDGERYIV